MMIDPQVLDIVKLLAGAYFVFCLNKTDRNQRELFKRLRAVELACAANHRHLGIKDTDEDT